jgi:hypothetical protein
VREVVVERQQQRRPAARRPEEFCDDCAVGPAQNAALRGGRSRAVAAAVVLVAVAALVAASSFAKGSPPRLAARAAAFDPMSVTFVSLDTGWTLGTEPCRSAGACLALRETTDGGHAWFARSLPAVLLALADRKINGTPADLYEGPGAGLNVRFADPNDGWIYGGLGVPPTTPRGYPTVAATLWSTHDGGLIWQRQTVSGLGLDPAIYDVEARHGIAYLLQSNHSYGMTVKSSPATQDHWRVSPTPLLRGAAGGTFPSGSFVFAGSNGWLVEGNDRGTDGSARLAANGRWVRWTPPCASVGHSFAIPAASTPENLVATCTIGGFAYGLSKSDPPGAKIGSNWLYFSNDAGARFRAGPELQFGTYVYSDALTSPSPQVILLGSTNGNRPDMVASFDGGVRWAVAYTAYPLFVGFTSPSQGVAIVRTSSSTTALIMSYDGGHTWAPVSF